MLSVVRDVMVTELVERWLTLQASYILHATCQNAAKCRRCCENEDYQGVFYSKLCTRLHVYGAVRRDRAASDGDVYSIGRHPTTNTGERDDANTVQ